MFVAQVARDWRAESTVTVRPGDFPDDEQTNDHRPVEAIFDPTATVSAWTGRGSGVL